jgi:hypothetical protein
VPERLGRGRARRPGEPERRRGSAPAAPNRHPDPHPDPLQGPLTGPPGGSPSGAAAPEDGSLDLAAATHFEAKDRAVWAWVEGRRIPTPWARFDEVELAFGDVLFIRLQPSVLLNPHAALELKPLFGGRAKVLLKGGQELTASREAARKLKFILGL